MEVLQQMSIANGFTIVVDEFSCLFTDARLKGKTELQLLHLLNALPNRIVYISATPIEEYILDAMDEFKNMPYVTLLWNSSRLRQVEVITGVMKSVVDEAVRIINEYKSSADAPAFRYFDAVVRDGRTYYSREAVFFLNDVSAIVSIIEKCQLTPAEVLIVCAEGDRNSARIRQLGKGFTIGHIPAENEPNKTFTFVTKHSFEGVDFYSDNSSTYIFANPNTDNLNLDISIDLPQIIGRCRTISNPFRNRVWFFHKHTDMSKLQEVGQEIEQRYERTERLLEKLQADDTDILDLIEYVQKDYSHHYMDVIQAADGARVAVCNNLVYWADRRALQIKQNQYKGGDAVCQSLLQNGLLPLSISTMTGNPIIQQFLTAFEGLKGFVQKMQYYIGFCVQQPNLQSVMAAHIQLHTYDRYLTILGAERIKALSYKQADLDRAIKIKQSSAKIQEALQSRLQPNVPYPCKQLKETLQQVYVELGIDKTATATDIVEYFETQEKKVVDDTGNRVNGLMLIAPKIVS